MSPHKTRQANFGETTYHLEIEMLRGIKLRNTAMCYYGHFIQSFPNTMTQLSEQ